MSEAEPLTGHAAVEQGQGYKPAPTEPTPAEPTTYGSGIQGVMDAGNDLTRERGSSETEPVERFLEWKSGSKAGQRVDLKAERMSLTAEAAAKTLSEVHRTEDAMEAHANLSELQREVDLARHQVAAAQQPLPDAQQSAQAETPQPIDSPQPEAGEAPPSGLSPKVAAALADPEIRQAIEATIAPADQARQQYEQGLSQLTEFAAAGVLAKLQSKYPNITGPQIPAAMQLLESQDPNFLAEIRADANRAVALCQASRQVQAQQAQEMQKQFNGWAKAQDAELEAKVPEIANDPDMKVSKAALRSLKDVGYSEEELAAAWNGQPFSMRDHRAQLLIWKAAQYDMARAGVGRPEAPALPPVQRPGISSSVGERTFVDTSDLRRQLKSARGLEAVRIATKMHQAQRAARR